ncbi:MAG: hypothetical protein ACLQBA_25345 [Candidatus Binataceae bacterium]
MRIIKHRDWLAATLLALALAATPAWAQLAVSDGPVEGNTTTIAGNSTVMAGTLTGIATQQLPAIITQDTITAQSLTTPGGAGRFQSQLSYLNALMQTLGSGSIANAQSFAAIYPGWVDIGPNAAVTAAQITSQTLATYADAVSVAQTQAANFSAEDERFQTLEACNAASVSVLQALQCGNEINLAAAQQTQALRQLEITHIIVDAVDHGEQLNENAQLGANAQTYFLTGAQQQ